MSSTGDSFDPKILGGSIKRKIVNPDLQEERNKMDFKPRELMKFVAGKQNVKESTRFLEILEKHPDMKFDINTSELTREQVMDKWWSVIHKLYTIEKDHYFTKNSTKEITTDIWQNMLPGVSPITLHSTMFTKTVKYLGSKEQVEKFMPHINSMRMIGCYAQTELGHGSNVAGLETTATLDTDKDEFVIHSPSIRATKFWPGSLGRHSNHAIVFARLITQGNDYGPQPFMVQIRSFENHLPLPGVKVGDIGTKMGYNSIDNGYLSFDHYRIPRENMLCRFVKVDKEGNFELAGDPRIVYQIMVITRLQLLFTSGATLLRGCTIASRYGACRRQFASIKGSRQERKLLDYQAHMHTIGPNLANGYVILMSAMQIAYLFDESSKAVEKGSFKLLDILHHFTAGFKSIMTEFAYYGSDQLRQSCGGAGFLAASGVASNFTDNAPLVTYEGVNVLMSQQSSRYIFKQVKKIKNGKKCVGFFEYINHLKKLQETRSQASSPEEFSEIDNLDQAMSLRAAYHIEKVSEMIENSKEPSKVKTNELFAPDVQRMTRNHLTYMMFKLSMRGIEQYKFKNERNKYYMILMVKIYALRELQTDNQALYETGYFTAGKGQGTLLLDGALKIALKELRPQIVNLSEIIGNPLDSNNLSVIGNYYGDIYETQYESAVNSNLNKSPVPPYYEKYMKPIIHGKL